MINTKNWFSYILYQYFIPIFPWVLLFLGSLENPSDSDLGWHLKYGEYFFRYGQILRENTFSASMPGFLWINSSWLTDPLTYVVFHWSGFLGLTILGAVVFTLACFLFFRSAKLDFWGIAILVPLITYLEHPLTVVSFRGQLLTLLFLGALYYLFSLYENGRKRMLLLSIPLFMLWANFHGGFLVGLGILFSWIGVYLSIKLIPPTRLRLSAFLKEMPFVFLVLAGSVGAVLINPFGMGLYEESFRHFNNPLQKYILEWLPFPMSSSLWWQLAIWTIIIIISATIALSKKKLTKLLPYLIITIILLTLSYWVRRYAWVMYLVSIPVVAPLITFLKPQSKKVVILLGSIFLIIFYVYTIFFLIPPKQIQNMSWQRYCSEHVGCSPEAIEYLLKTKPPGKILTFYNWGGWLIWLYPEIKPTIDGRMHLWRDSNGYSAFSEYYKYEQNWIEIDDSDYDAVLISHSKPLADHLAELTRSGKWQVAYSDDFAAIFVRAAKNRAPLKQN